MENIKKLLDNNSMIYLIYGNQTATIKSRINKILKSSLDVVDEMNFVKYNGQNSLVQEFVDDANYLPLGYDKKVIVVENCYFLLSPKPKNKIESDQDYETLKNYIKASNPDCELILTVVSSQLDSKNEIFQLIKEHGNIVQIVDPGVEEWKEYVKKYCKENLGMKIDNDALEELTNRTSGDVALLQNNAKKLALYKEHIRYEDVVLMVARPLEDNSFLIFNYLTQGKNGDALALFRDLKSNNVQPVVLIKQVSNQFRLLNQISYLAKKGYSDEEIGQELNIKPIRAKIMKKSLSTVSEKCIYRTLDELFNLDYQIKSGQVDHYYAFELFLINFKRR